MRFALPLQVLLTDELQAGVVHEFGGLDGLSWFLASHVVRSQPP